MKAEEIARERISILFEEAAEKSGERSELAERYVELARRIGERTQVSIPSQLRKRFCGSCSTYWIPGKNCNVRINSKNGTVKYSCKECGEVERYGLEG